MAVTTEGIDKAEITQCVELNGRFKRTLPWVFVKFSDVSEANRYVMPAGNGLHLAGAEPFRVTEEAALNAPFPYEAFTGPRDTTTVPGAEAIHYFGQQF